MARNKYTLFRFLAGALFVLVALFMRTPVYAQSGSEVGAVLCYSESPVLLISQPLSDSVTNVPTIPLEGTTQYTSQIDILINGSYSHSVAIGFNGVLQTQVSLQQGTNTITLEAYFSCNNTNAEEDIIVEYQPEVLPTDPENVDTEVVSTSVGDEVISQSTEPRSLFSQKANEIQEKLGFEPTEQSYEANPNRSSVSIAFNWLLFAILIFCFGLFFASPTIIEKLVAFLGLKTRPEIKNPHKFLRILLLFIVVFLAFILSMV